jgi:site-specific DNA-cytosine methylase
MRLLVACEFSGVVRRAFRALGHDAVSCDLLPAEDGSRDHIKGDVLRVLGDGWDGIIAHPPCTRLTVAGARWFKGKEAEQAAAIAFVESIWNAGIPRTAIENPIGVLSTRSGLGKPTQIIQPWQFGHGETKATCLWLRGFPKLIPTNIVAGREARIHRMAPSPDRWKERSRTYTGIAEAMANQWGAIPQQEVA